MASLMALMEALSGDLSSRSCTQTHKTTKAPRLALSCPRCVRVFPHLVLDGSEGGRDLLELFD
jgi:hypothetical protein